MAERTPAEASRDEVERLVSAGSMVGTAGCAAPSAALHQRPIMGSGVFTDGAGGREQLGQDGD